MSNSQYLQLRNRAPDDQSKAIFRWTLYLYICSSKIFMTLLTLLNNKIHLRKRFLKVNMAVANLLLIH